MFTEMKHGTADDWTVIAEAHRIHQAKAVPLQILDTLRRLQPMELGFSADQLTHSLMTATLARRDGATDEQVVAALCHDMGKVMSVPNHGAIAAEILKPYVSDDVYKAVYWHQHFQGAFYFEFFGKPKDLRKQFQEATWYAFAEKLVDDWDAPAFDPSFAFDPLESFEPEVSRVFVRAV
jgi:predicted HD phosphohydrolase